MKKNKTVGKVGENIVKKLLTKHNIEFEDQIGNIVKKRVIVNCTNINGHELNYSYNKKIKSHPFDILIGDKKCEIKTSRLKKGFFNFNLLKNDRKIIDFVILVILSETNKLLNFHIFDKNVFSKQVSMRCRNNELEPLKKRKFIKIIKQNCVQI